MLVSAMFSFVAAPKHYLMIQASFQEPEFSNDFFAHSPFYCVVMAAPPAFTNSALPGDGGTSQPR